MSDLLELVEFDQTLAQWRAFKRMFNPLRWFRRPYYVDEPIADLVRVLNENGYPTRASCSGHGFRPGNIALRDGRELIIARDHAEARRIDALFPLDINGISKGNPNGR